MNQLSRWIGVLVWSGAVYGQGLELSALTLKNATAEERTYHGAKALRLMEKSSEGGDSLAFVKTMDLGEGTIELYVAGAPAQGAGEGARGFIGLAFHVQPGGSRYECIYLRPTNGRAAEQIRRNHATQYISFPDWPWERLRQEAAGSYESYVDLQVGEWTRMRVTVNGTKAFLYVGDAAQPCLVVHDLKLGAVRGGVALWIGPGTEGYFRDLKIARR